MKRNSKIQNWGEIYWYIRRKKNIKPDDSYEKRDEKLSANQTILSKDRSLSDQKYAKAKHEAHDWYDYKKRCS